MEYYEKIKSSINLESINYNISNNLDNIYQTILLPQFKEENNCNLTKCSIFDFTKETKDYLDDMINRKINNIKKRNFINQRR